MKRNVSNLGRIVRAVIGLFVLSLIFWGPKSLWGLLGLLPLFAALSGWCPPYSVCNISECKKEQSSQQSEHPESVNQ